MPHTTWQRKERLRLATTFMRSSGRSFGGRGRWSIDHKSQRWVTDPGMSETIQRT